MKTYQIAIVGMPSEESARWHGGYFFHQGMNGKVSPVESYIERWGGMRSYRCTVTVEAEEIYNNDPRCTVTILEA